MSGFELCTVLVVEDHMAIRTLLASVLKSMGVGNVLRANNGAQAIEMMKTMRLKPELVGASEIDAIVSDWVMDDIDGATLLRWVRRHKESPDRFMPFLMLSAYSDAERVQFARDLGVTEFMAKPFTAGSLASHLVTAMQDERHFVWVGQYFGPDRRRRIEDVPADKRDSETPYAEKGVRYYPPPKRRRQKLGKDFEVDSDTLDEVQEELESWSEDFMDWTREYVERLTAASNTCKNANVKQRAGLFSQINQMAHELRGQGGMFGYPLITTISKSLFDLTLSNTNRSNECVRLIRNHIDTLKAIMRDDVRGDGGELGEALVGELKRANAQFLASPSSQGAVSRAFEQANQ